MSHFDFETPVERTGTHSLKWDLVPGVLPCWVADMDFRTAPVITDALVRTASRGLFCYTLVPPEWRASLSNWWSRRYGWNFSPDAVVFSTGVMPAVHSLVRTFTRPGEKVVVMTPVYHCFFQAIEENGRTPLAAPLKHNPDLSYEIDWEALDAALADPLANLLILCNPHNPTGTVWSAEELHRIGNLALKHGVLVISDEIHGDLTRPKLHYTPFAAAASAEAVKNSITCVSPSKTFNIPALGASAAVVPDARLRARVAAGFHRDQIGNPNAFAIDAVIAAYDEGEPWLEELLQVLDGNKRFACEFLAHHLPEVRCRLPEATYLLWFDCSAITPDASQLVDHLQKTEGLMLSPGAQFRGDGAAMIRFNAGTQRVRLEDALERFARGVKSFAR